MRTNKHLVVSTLTLAVQGALLAMFAMPAFADEDIATLTQPTNTIEVGIQNVSKDSAKFGEYNGLNTSGATPVGNFRISGGDGYKDATSSNRWEVNGSDLGTTSREVSASISNQGQWNLGFSLEELTHNITDTYHTPLVGDMGGNSFTLPASFGVINTAYIGPASASAATTVGTQALTLAQQAYLSAPATLVHSDRDTSKFTAGYTFDRQWNVKFDVTRIDQTGAKLIGASTDGTAAAIKYGTYSYGKEAMMVLMNPTSYTTNNFNLALNWTGDKAYFTASYYASLFSDAYNGLTFPNMFVGGSTTVQTPVGSAGAAGLPIDTLSTAPNNNFNQLNLTGGYKLSPTTKLAGGLSYARNTQNTSYPFAVMQTGGLPQSSLNGLVITTHADLRLTDQTTRDLQLTAAVKYNKRDNQTASAIYKFLDLGVANETSVNAPMSNSKTQAELAGDYRLSANNRVHLGYEYEDVKRWCDNSLANTTTGVITTITNTSCAQVPEAKENKLVASYRLKAGDSVNFNIGYSHAQRDATVNPSFYNPLQANSQGYENFGYRAFFEASRQEQVAKAGINWQATDQFSLGLNGRYVDDKYTDSPLGVQTGKNWSANLDATYAYSDNGVISGYMTAQNRQRNLLSGGPVTTVVGTTYTAVSRFPTTLDPSQWSNQLKDEDNTVGINITQKGLLGGKLELGGDLSYSLGKTGYSSQVPYLIATTAIPTLTCSNTQNLTCTSTPDIKSESVRVKLTGTYQLDKASKVALGLMYQRLTSTDYYYNAYQYGYTPQTLIPTNQQAPSYSVTAIGVSYIFNF